MFIYCICTQYLVRAPFALITASIRRGMEVISLWHCWGGMEAQVSLTVAFRSSAFFWSLLVSHFPLDNCQEENEKRSWLRNAQMALHLGNWDPRWQRDLTQRPLRVPKTVLLCHLMLFVRLKTLSIYREFIRNSLRTHLWSPKPFGYRQLIQTPTLARGCWEATRPLFTSEAEPQDHGLTYWVPTHTRRCRKRCERGLKRGKRGGIRARLRSWIPQDRLPNTHALKRSLSGK